MAIKQHLIEQRQHEQQRKEYCAWRSEAEDAITRAMVLLMDNDLSVLISTTMGLLDNTIDVDDDQPNDAMKAYAELHELFERPVQARQTRLPEPGRTSIEEPEAAEIDGL